MKSLLLAAPLLAASLGAHAQFNPPGGSTQSVTVSAGQATDTRTQAGSPGSLDATAIDAGASSIATTRIGPGVVSGSLDTRVNGSGGTSASMTAYQHDELTFERKDGSFDNALVVYYNIVISGAASASFTPATPATPSSGGGTAGSVDWTFVHRIDDFYLTSWDSTTTLGADGRSTTTNHWNIGEIGRLDGVYTFSAAVMAGNAIGMDLYMEMNSRLGGNGLAGTGAIGASGDTRPSITWGGISQVTDWYGNRVDYRVSSASGFNYALSAVTSPAPEPSTWALLLAGSAMLFVRGRTIARMRRAVVGPASSIA